MSRILLVDDVIQLAEQYAYDLRRIGGHETLVAGNGLAALERIEHDAIDCVILDLEMPGMDGYEVLRTLQHRGVETPVIVYTGTGDYDRCIQAIRLGAVGFIDKAEPMERVAHEVSGALERSRLRREVRALQDELSQSQLLGMSPGMKELREIIGRVAPIPSSVLITGESGSGKELVARELHRLSAHPNGPFVPINCAALPENLVESELFGHERGAFTGAIATRKGAFEAADKGTLFLDEIGELPLPAQAKLLRVLEDRVVMRLGSNRGVPVAARILAATNRDLEELVRAGDFREDLFFRINVHRVQVPPLRDRPDDIILLAERFLEETCRRFGLLPKRLSGEVRQVLVAYDWKRNNLRELRNVVERMVVLTDGDVIRAEQVPPEVRGVPSEAVSSTASSYQDLKTDAERRIILAALEKHDWHITHTAESLELADHASLLKIMRRLGIKR